jgi:putative hemolysin
MSRSSLDVRRGNKTFTVSIFKLGASWYCHTRYGGRHFVTRMSSAEWNRCKDPHQKIIEALCSGMGTRKAVTVAASKLRIAA